MIRYRDNNSDEDSAALLEECILLDKCYAENAESEVQADEEEESFDPVRYGWVDKNGRP